MRRFYFEDEEGEDDEDNDIEDMAFMMPGGPEFISMAHLDNPDNSLLGYAIKICEKSLFWRFRTISGRMKMIEDAYDSLKKITEGENDAKI